jgi:uncharacterized membrane protein YgcG
MATALATTLAITLAVAIAGAVLLVLLTRRLVTGPGRTRRGPGARPGWSSEGDDTADYPSHLHAPWHDDTGPSGIGSSDDGSWSPPDDRCSDGGGSWGPSDRGSGGSPGDGSSGGDGGSSSGSSSSSDSGSSCS